jgi:hypothetical protein
MIHEKPRMGHGRAHSAEKSLSFCRLTKQRLINELADGINERYGWYDDASPDHRPKFRVFTEKAIRSTTEAPAHLIAIADIWAEYQALGYAQVAQLLYDRGIYRANSKDGTEHVMNRGTLAKMVKRCEALGLL